MTYADALSLATDLAKDATAFHVWKHPRQNRYVTKHGAASPPIGWVKAATVNTDGTIELFPGAPDQPTVTAPTLGDDVKAALLLARDALQVCKGTPALSEGGKDRDLWLERGEPALDAVHAALQGLNG